MQKPKWTKTHENRIIRARGIRRLFLVLMTISACTIVAIFTIENIKTVRKFSNSIANTKWRESSWVTGLVQKKQVDLSATVLEVPEKCVNPHSIEELFGPCVRKANQVSKMPIIFAMANNVGRDGGLCRFLEGAVWNGFNRVIVMGWSDENETKIPQLDGTKEWFFGGRHTMAATLLEIFNVSDDQLVLGIDSLDVLVQEGAQTIAAKYAEMSAAYASDALSPLAESEFGCAAGAACPPLIYATENDCWPPSFKGMYEKYYQDLTAAWPKNASAAPPSRLVPAPADRTYRHLNGGGFLGPAGALRRVLRELIADKDAYAQHELVYDDRGRITGGGRVQQEVSITASLIIWAMMKATQCNVHQHVCVCVVCVFVCLCVCVGVRACVRDTACACVRVFIYNHTIQ